MSSQDYILVAPDGMVLRPFCSDGTAVWQPGSPNEGRTQLSPGESPLSGLARVMGQLGNYLVADCKLVPTELPNGHCYFRMARSLATAPQDRRGFYPGHLTPEIELANSRGQLVALMEHLQRICQTIHPTRGNFEVYGHDIRNLLILASTEVEAQWRAVLLANGATPSGNGYTTKEYVLLAKPMRLQEYAISLPYYPWLEPLRPFASWQVGGRPTQDLSWYDAYNAVKHDREQNFTRGTLLSALEAVCAVTIMLVAQFGPAMAFRWRIEFGYFFQIADAPQWPPEQLYIGPDPSTDWVGINYRLVP